MATHPLVLHPGSVQVSNWRRESHRPVLVAREYLLQVLRTLQVVCPSVTLVHGLAERKAGGGDCSPPAALQVVPAPRPAPQHLN